jgi:hypothetical protein
LKKSFFAFILSALAVVSARSVSAQSTEVLNDCHEVRLDHENGDGDPSHSTSHSCFGDLMKAAHTIIKIKYGPHAKDIDTKLADELADQYSSDAGFFGKYLTESEKHILLRQAGYTQSELDETERIENEIERKHEQYAAEQAGSPNADQYQKLKQCIIDAPSGGINDCYFRYGNAEERERAAQAKKDRETQATLPPQQVPQNH